MPGPLKKDPSLLARRNKPPSRTVLKIPKNPKVPSLPTGMRWYPQVRDWWKRQWSSPMPQMWSDSDRDMMFLAARLWQQFWDPETSASTRNQTSAQLRAVADQLGLTPMSRNRLGWELPDPDDKPESSSGGSRSKSAPAKKAAAKDADPRRRRLQVVS